MDKETKELYELTRQGKNLCETCGAPKVMYYKPWCPMCEKDDALSKEQVVNMIQVLRYFEALDGNSIWKNGVWEPLVDFLDYPGNDSHTLVHVDDIFKNPKEYSPDVVELFRRIAEHFDLEDTILAHLSW